MTVDIGNKAKVFNLSEANELLPLVQTITQRHQSELAPCQARLNKMLSNDPRRGHTELEYEAIVSRWRNKIEQLGASVPGLWMVDFDVGEGVLSWRHPELSIAYFRLAGAGISERFKLVDYIDEHDPDWTA